MADPISTNLSKTKRGTKSLKKIDFWSKIGTFSRNSQNYQVKGQSVMHKLLYKKVGQSKEQAGQQ